MKFFSTTTRSDAVFLYLVVTAVVLLLSLSLSSSTIAEGFTLSHNHRRRNHVGTNKGGTNKVTGTGRQERTTTSTRPNTVSPTSTAPTTTTTLVVAATASAALTVSGVDGAVTSVATQAEAWTRHQQLQLQQHLDEKRREVTAQVAMGITSLVSSISSSLSSSSSTTSKNSNSIVDTSTSHDSKLWNLSNEELSDIIVRDGREKQFLFTADLTREIYDESCMFCDGSDLDGSYPIDAWVRGCRFLFDSNESSSRIIEDTLRVSSHRVVFTFEEELQFNMIPSFLRRSLRRISLTGSVIMDRDPQTGLIVQYQEVWDQSLGQLMKQMWTDSVTVKATSPTTMHDRDTAIETAVRI